MHSALFLFFRFDRISLRFPCSGNAQLKIFYPYQARCHSTETLRRGPPMVTDEVPVDTTKYSDVLIKLNGYDPAVLTSFYHYVDQAARSMKFDVTKKFNLATEAFSVTLANPPHFFREKNMQYNFKNHGRMIQIESIPSEMADIFLQCVQKNIPPGVSVQFELKKWQDFVSPPSQRSGEAVY